jgi:hypothetical protein
LRNAALSAARSWNDAFARSPAERGPRAWVLGAPIDPAYQSEDAARAERMLEVTDVATAGKDSCNKALNRLTDLERDVDP